MLDNVCLNYHASIKIIGKDKIIYFDPYKIDSNFHDANFIFITHSHYDHFSLEDIKKVMNEDTYIFVTSDIEEQIKYLTQNYMVVKPGKRYNIKQLVFDTIQAYNIDKKFHPKDNNWVGYNVLIDDMWYYVMGDTDLTLEAKSVICDVIFVPVGGIYTMDYKEANNLVNSMSLKIAIPIHYDENLKKENAYLFIENLNKDIKGIILR